MLVYADSDDLADWTKKPAPDNADILLREASILVADACLADLYDTDSTGLPPRTQLCATRCATQRARRPNTGHPPTSIPPRAPAGKSPPA